VESSERLWQPPDPEAAALGRILAGDPLTPSDSDWERLVPRAIDERIAPLVYWKRRDDGALPARFRTELRRELFRAEASNLILYRELASLLRRSHEEGLHAPVLLKGGALATSLYPEIGLRPMSDLDLLVSREELPRWLALAEEESFHRVSPEMGRGLTERVHYHVALSGGTTGGASIEIHFGLLAGETDARAPETSWFFARTEPWRPPAPVDGPPARALEPTAHLPYLGAHAMLQHGGAQARMIWFHDIHLLVTAHAGRIRWDEVVEASRRFGWGAALSAALTRARALFGTDFPIELTDHLIAGADPDRLLQVRRRSEPSMSRAELVWSELQSVRFRHRLLWALAILFPRPEYLRWRYPGAGRFWPACYPYRWARVVWEGAHAVAVSGLRWPGAGYRKTAP
jgi:hypothetical protein